MDKQALFASAATLKQPSQEAAQAYGRKRAALAAAVTEALRGREDLDRLVGPGNAAMMEDNHANHGRFLESVFQDYDPERLVETILWVFRAYRARGFQLTYWPAQLNAWLNAMHAELPEAFFSELAPFYIWMLREQPAFASLSESAPSAWEPAPQHT